MAGTLAFPTLHATFVFERVVPAPIAQVFETFADPAMRAEWGAPSDTAVIIYDAADFRVGGEDRFRCGAKRDPNIHVTAHYLEITPDRRIVTSQTVEMNGQRLAASLTTVELLPEGDTTHLRSTVQVASFVGEDMIRGHEAGNNGSLDSLVRYVSR